MSFNVNVGGTWRPTAPWVNVGGVWKQVQQAWVNVAGTWRMLYQLALVTLDRSSGSASRTTGGSLTVPCTATGSPSGGTYAWTTLSGGAGITIGNAAAPSVGFTGTVNATTPTRTGTYRCTYTLNGFSSSADFSVTLSYTG